MPQRIDRIFRLTICVALFGLAFIFVLAIGAACSTRPQTQQVASARPEESCSEASPAKPDPACPSQHAIVQAPHSKPSIPQESASLPQQPTPSAQEYRNRIAKARETLHSLRRAGKIDESMRVFKQLLDDVEANEDVDMAQRAALADAGTLQGEKDFLAAVRAYEIYVERFPKGRFVDEALFHTGECQLELKEYEQAETIWTRLIEEHDLSPLAPWGWRRLALVQLLRGQFDASLSTLDVMANKYAKTQWADYAKMRRGYVLTAANRVSEAKATYQKFLADCSGSRYCVLARKQLADLNESTLLAGSRK